MKRRINKTNWNLRKIIDEILYDNDNLMIDSYQAKEFTKICFEMIRIGISIERKRIDKK